MSNLTMAIPEPQENHIKTIRELLGLESLDLPILVEEPAEEPKENIVLEPRTKVHRKPSLLSRDTVRYPLIFLIALGFFYLILNFRAVSSQVGTKAVPPPKNEEAALGDDSARFQKWIKKYYAFVNNKEILAANNDADSDGLTNHDEFYLGTNPLKRDTDEDGFDDGREVLGGYNPSYEGKLTANQQKQITEHLNLSEISTRRDYENVRKVAGEVIELPLDDFQLDPSRPGKVEIPKIGVDAPIIWTKEFSQIQEDLKYGAAHHPLTKYPGQKGLSSIHGHSSGYPWDGNYKHAFTKINFLAEGDEVFATVYGTNGESRRYRYLVRSKAVFAKNDERQFQDLGGHHLNLSTSWPIGTALERYVVSTELVGL